MNNQTSDDNYDPGDPPGYCFDCETELRYLASQEDPTKPDFDKLACPYCNSTSVVIKPPPEILNCQFIDDNERS